MFCLFWASSASAGFDWGPSGSAGQFFDRLVVFGLCRIRLRPLGLCRVIVCSFKCLQHRPGLVESFRVRPSSCLTVWGPRLILGLVEALVGLFYVRLAVLGFGRLWLMSLGSAGFVERSVGSFVIVVK